MNKFQFKSAGLLYFMALFTVYGFQSESKELYQELEVHPDVVVEIENQFGDLTLSSWDQNKVSIAVRITVKGTNPSRIQEKLNEIDVDFMLSPERVKAQTIVEEGWGFKWLKSSRLNYQIDYHVKLPKSAAINIENNYGSIVLNELEGKAVIRCDYGKLLLGDLLHEDNFLSFDYTSNSSIDFIKGGTIQADYSSFEVSEAGIISLKADYTQSKFTTLKNLEFKNDYGKLTIEQINQLKGSGDFLTLRAAKVFQNIALNQEFGSIRIDSLNPTVTSVTIDSEYTGINLGLDPNWDFTYEIHLEFASLKSNVALQHQIQKEGGTEKNYKGYSILENSSNKLQIDSEFGSVKLNY